MNLLVGEIKWFSPGWHNRRIEVETPPGALWRRLRDGPLDAAQDQLASRAALPNSRLVEAAVQITGQVNAGADRILVHECEYSAMT